MLPSILAGIKRKIINHVSDFTGRSSGQDHISEEGLLMETLTDVLDGP